MLAKKLPIVDSEGPIRPLAATAGGALEPAALPRTHLLLVRSPNPTPRGLAWARHGGALTFDAASLQSMLRFERLNLG